MPETKKTCGHEPNPKNDVDSRGVPYDSCYQCFIEDYEKLEDAHHKAQKKYLEEHK